MGRLTPILRLQWRAYWRRFTRPRSFAAGNQGILLIVAVLIFVKYVSALNVAAVEVSRGKTAMLDRLLLGIFLAWLFPLMSNTRISITARALRHFPLTLKDLFAIKTASLFMSPFTWLILAGSIAIAYPISYAPNPIAGIAAVVLFILTSWFLGLTAAHLISNAVWRKLIFVPVLVLLTVAVVAVVREGDRVNLEGRLSVLSPKLVSNVALGEHLLLSFSSLLALVAIAACSALWSFRASLRSVDTSRPQKGTSFSLLSNKTGPLSVKDLRYSRRLLDPYLGLLVSAGGCFYLLMSEQPTAEVFWIFIVLVFLPSASLTFNSFGLDNRSGLDRYLLLPVSGKEIMLSKNVSFVIFVGLQILPMILLATWQLGFRITGLGIVQAALIALAYMTWGNLIAVGHRFKMEFFRFSSGGSPIDVLAGIIFGSLPGAIAWRLFDRGNWWGTILMVIFYFTLYFASLTWSGRKFERANL